MNEKTPEKIRLSDRKRRAVLDAALTEFEANGFEATSMDRIAATANVSKRTVYNHFDSKENLFDSMRKEMMDAIEYSVKRYEPTEPLESQLLSIAQRQFELQTCATFMKFARVSVSRCMHSPALAASSFNELQKSRQTMVKWIKNAVADGRLNVESPKLAARHFIGLLSTWFLWPQLIGAQPVPSKREQKKIIESTVAMFLDHYATENS